MKTKHQNTYQNVFLYMCDDFPSLLPKEPQINKESDDEKQAICDNNVESTLRSSEQFLAPVNLQEQGINIDASKSLQDFTSKAQNLKNGSQFYDSALIFEAKNTQANNTPPEINQNIEPIKTKVPEPIIVRKLPMIGRRKQVFTYLELISTLKVQQKPTATLDQQKKEVMKEVPKIQTSVASKKIKKDKQNQRPLDKFALQMINRYKKQLRKQSYETVSSYNPDEEKSEESTEQIDMFDEIERNYTIMEFRLGNVFHKVIRGDFQLSFRQPYSTHYEYTKAKKYLPTVDKVKEIQWITLSQLKVLNINLDLNINSRGGDIEHEEFLEEQYGFRRKTKVYYGGVTDQERAEHFIQIIKEAMFKGVDFILLQEGYQSVIRSLLLSLINQLACSQFGKYFYPDNIENFEYDNRTTLILSKYPARFGQLQFEITEHQQQKLKKFYFPLQAFCEFEILIGKKVERIGILNCHLRSNGQRSSKIPPWRMRQKQLCCIHDWGKRQKYDRFFVIGDTNMPSGQKYKSQNIQADQKFSDAYDQGFTPIGGTYLYRNERNQVVDERMDRVLMNKECTDNTVVEIQYEDVLLKSCEGKNLDKKKMLEKYENQLTYVTLSDHKIMNITIYMTKKK